MTTLEERFWSKVDWEGRDEDECWEWQAAKASGYGRFTLGGRIEGAHRVAFELEYGPIPEGIVIRHTCDNPPCCNPRHLVPGTGADNCRDAVERGRARGGNLKGEANNKAKLNADKVREIRCRYRPGLGPALAAEFGVSQQLIIQVVNRQVWAHIE